MDTVNIRAIAFEQESGSRVVLSDPREAQGSEESLLFGVRITMKINDSLRLGAEEINEVIADSVLFPKVPLFELQILGAEFRDDGL